MILNYIYIAVLASFPEALLMLLIGFNLSNIRDIKLSKLLIIAGIQSVIALFVRIFNIYFGFHAIIQIISLYLLVLIFLKIKYYKAIIPVLIGIATQGVIQSIMLPIINIAWGIEITNIYYNSKGLILCYIPVAIISLILLFVIRRNNLFLCDIND